MILIIKVRLKAKQFNPWIAKFINLIDVLIGLLYLFKDLTRYVSRYLMINWLINRIVDRLIYLTLIDNIPMKWMLIDLFVDHYQIN